MTFPSRTDSPQPPRAQGPFDRAKGVVGTRQGDTTVLLDVHGGMYYTLNEAAGRIWELLGERTSVSAIVVQLGEEYDVPMDRLVAEVGALMNSLRAAKLIEAARQ